MIHDQRLYRPRPPRWPIEGFSIHLDTGDVTPARQWVTCSVVAESLDDAEVVLDGVRLLTRGWRRSVEAWRDGHTVTMRIDKAVVDAVRFYEGVSDYVWRNRPNEPRIGFVSPNPPGHGLSHIMRFAGGFIAVGDKGEIQTSDGGVQWTARGNNIIDDLDALVAQVRRDRQ